MDTFLDEGVYFHGNQLADLGKVSKLTEAEKHLWIAEVLEDGRYEVEVKISPSKVLAYTCECQRYKEYGMCAHIAAVLILVRRKKNTNKEKREERKRQKRNSAKKLTTNVILDQISKEELQAFVRQYAKTNRTFSIALKARFASNVSSIDSKEKFMQLLDSAINHSRKQDRSISHRGSQKILKILKELQAQLEDALARAHYFDAVGIAQSIIEKISPTLKKLSSNADTMRAHIDEAFDALHRVVNSDAPPDLIENIWEYSLEESRKIIYRANAIDLKFFRIAIQLLNEQERIEEINVVLDEQIEKYKKEQRSLSPILLIKINVLEKAKQKGAVKRLIEENLNRSDILFYAINQAIEQKDYKKAESLAKSGLKLPQIGSSTYRLEHILFTIAKMTQNRKALVKYSKSLFIKSLNFDYFLACKKNAGAPWPEIRQDILDQLLNMPFSERRRDSIAMIYTEENMKVELLDYLKSTQSIDLLKSFDQYLLPEYQDALSRLYKELLTRYLNTHLGRIPSQKIRECIYHLKELGNHQLADELVVEFRAAFPERHTLMEELAFF